MAKPMKDPATWRSLLKAEATVHGDDLSALVFYPATTLWPVDFWTHEPVPDATVQSALDVTFDAGYGTSHGPQFTAWSANRVYFPVVYDGWETVGSAPRNPCDEATPHVGGE